MTTTPRFDEVQLHPDEAVTAYTYFDARPELLEDLSDFLFRKHWSRIVVGPCIEGAWHFHLGIGPHNGSPSEELRRMRPVARVAFFERRGKGCGSGRFTDFEKAANLPFPQSAGVNTQ